MEIVLSFFVGGLIVGAFVHIMSDWKLERVKAENYLLNQKLQRNNPRDAHGRFTRKK